MLIDIASEKKGDGCRTDRQTDRQRDRGEI